MQQRGSARNASRQTTLNSVQSPLAPYPPHSAFVSATAWSFLLVAAFGAFMNALQLLLMFTVLPPADYFAIASDLQSTQSLPSFLVFIVEHMVAWTFLALVLSLLTLVASVGLLRRQNWARIVFVVIMWLGVAANLAGAAAPLVLGPMAQSLLQSFPIEMRGDLQSMMTMMTWLSVGLALLFAALFAWTAVKLMSAAVRRECGAS
jgi:hypothetical protein